MVWKKPELQRYHVQPEEVGEAVHGSVANQHKESRDDKERLVHAMQPSDEPASNRLLARLITQIQPVSRNEEEQLIAEYAARAQLVNRVEIIQMRIDHQDELRRRAADPGTQLG